MTDRNNAFESIGNVSCRCFVKSGNCILHLLKRAVPFSAGTDLSPQHLNERPIVTSPPPVDPSGKYTNFVRIQKFEDKFKW